jgi:CubicO group peptidase (beta-lactamase class C family)
VPADRARKATAPVPGALAVSPAWLAGHRQVWVVHQEDEESALDIATPEDVGFSSARLRRIGATMRRFVDEGKIAGAVTLVARHAKVAHFEATGLIDQEARRPMERDAIFRIASMTKPITCTAALMLFEEGQFLLDDPIADFLPEFAQTKVFVRETAQGVELADLERPITIRHLLMHTSGLTYDFYPEDPVSRRYAREQIWRPGESLADKVKRFAALPLVHQPGADWTYGVSHDVLGRLVEVISGQPFEVYLQQRIFAPLEMTDTGFYVPPQHLSRLGPIYTPDGRGGLQRDEEQRDHSKPPAYPSPGGGLVSTAADYARFCQMLLNGGALGSTRLLGRKTVGLMTANHWTGAASPFPPDWAGTIMLGGYGFGLGVRSLVDVAQSGVPSSVGEYGWVGAYSTYFWIDPREQLYGVLMVQLSPLTLRTAWIFQVLTDQALVD